MYPKELKISTIVHFGILILVIVGPVIFPSRYRYKRATVHTVQLVNIPAVTPQKSPAVSKPIVKKPEPKVEPKPAPKKEIIQAKPKPVPVPKKTAPKKISTPSLEERLSKRFETVNKEKFAEPVSTPQMNIGVSGPSNFPFQYYLDIIHDKISSCWQEPQMVLDKQYTVIVTFTIMKDGSIQAIHTKRGSGVVNFDQSGKRAVELARPFPPLPQGYAHPQLTVNVAFNLE